MFNAQHTLGRLLPPLFLALLVSGCLAPEAEEGTNINQVALPTDTALGLPCADAGIYLERCILFDPNNPYAKVMVNDVTRWELEKTAPGAKAKFYLWATAQARSPGGVNQFYTAQSLHELYTASSDDRVKEQAQRAYRSVLDNYFGSVTYFLATWSSEPDVYYAQPLADLVGDNLYKQTASLTLLYPDQASVLGAISSWGYYYDDTTGTMAKIGG